MERINKLFKMATALSIYYVSWQTNLGVDPTSTKRTLGT